PVVIKVTCRETDEARHLAKTESDYVVPVRAYVWTDAGLDAIVMPDLGRETLRDVMATSARPDAVSVATRAGHDVARGLADLHANGLLHGDVKPENVLLGSPDGRYRLIDLNLSRTVESPYTTGGTHVYLAPEQSRDFVNGVPARVNEATDVYSLGAALFELFAGRPPVDPDQWYDPDRKPPFPTGRNAAERAVLKIVADCMSADPDLRPSAGKVAERISRLGSRRRRAVNFLSDNRAYVAAVAGVVAGLGAAAAPAASESLPRVRAFGALACRHAASAEWRLAGVSLRNAFGRTNPDDAKFASAWLAAVEGDYAEAVRFFDRLAADSPSGPACAAAAYCWHQVNTAGDLSLSLSAKALDLGFYNASSLHNHAAFLAQDHRFDEARGALQRSQELDPTQKLIPWTKLYIEVRSCVADGRCPNAETVDAVIPEIASATRYQRKTAALAVVLQGAHGEKSLRETVANLGEFNLSRDSLSLTVGLWPELDTDEEFRALSQAASSDGGDGRLSLADPFEGVIPGLESEVF
ncbi:MAG: protein kinase, partial [Planctomycetota bacterium]